MGKTRSFLKKAIFILAMVVLALSLLPGLCLLFETSIPYKWLNYQKGILLIPWGYGLLIVFLFLSLVFYLLQKVFPTTKVMAFNFLLMLFLFFCIDMRLRYNGVSPGMYYRNFDRVDVIAEDHINITDSLGLTKYNPAYNMPNGSKINVDGFLSTYNYTAYILDSIKKSGKKIVMIIGDSFVQGVSSTSWNKSFVELLRKNASQYEVINFGVGGMDPLNYRLVVEEYLKPIKPDLIVIVCCDNDMMQFDRKPMPGVPLYYSAANNGINTETAVMEGVVGAETFKTFEEAYKYFFYVNYRAINGNFFLKYVKRSSLATVLVSEIHRSWCFKFKDTTPLQGVTNKHLKAINSIATQNNVPCVFTLIPGIQNSKGDSTWLQKTARPEFKELETKTRFFTEAKFEDYISYQNQHFNDQGNEKFSVVLDSLIRLSTGLSPK